MSTTTDMFLNGNGQDRPGESAPERNEAESTVEEPETAVNGNGAAHPDVPTEQELKAVLEALLFVSHEPITLDRLAIALEGVAKSQIRQALGELQTEFERGERGLQIVELAGGFQMVTRPDYAPWIRRLGKTKAAPKLSRSGLESLAIIAYKQPIVRAEIEEIRGVETSGVLRTLLERKLIRMVGRKDVPGRPIMYGTTKYFLQHFGLRDLSELPPLREFKELGESEQAMLPIGEEPIQVENSETRVESNEQVTASLSQDSSEQV